MKAVGWITGVTVAAQAALALHAWSSIDAAEPAPVVRPRIDLVLALDTSGSMDGLIGSAKARLWDIVNELGSAQPAPDLRVALYTYGGMTGYEMSKGWVRQESAFTKDLDSLYEKLGALTTNGGNEYVARVVKAATEELDWSTDDTALKLVFVAGNEGVRQDPAFDVDAVAAAAREKGIVVSALYCGSPFGEAEGWASVARNSGGSFAAIDQEKGMKVASTPFDARLSQLSRDLTGTYVGYGTQGGRRLAAQRNADEIAHTMGAGVSASRAATKNNATVYDNSEWDLVDAMRSDPTTVDNLSDSDLPEPLRELSRDMRRARVEELSKRREAIAREIAELTAKREASLRATSSGNDSLDAAIKTSLRELGSQKGLAFP